MFEETLAVPSTWRILLVRPGCTDFDQQGRIKGTLDIPLCDDGTRQAEMAVLQLAAEPIDAIFSAPCKSARQTADVLAASRRLKPKVMDDFLNLDHGLWHGKRIEEVKQSQPRLYRQGQDHADTICPPQGESIVAGRERVRLALQRLLKKNRTGTLCLVVPDPLASIVESELRKTELDDLWENECDDGGWSMMPLVPDAATELGVRVVSPQPVLAKR